MGDLPMALSSPKRPLIQVVILKNIESNGFNLRRKVPPTIHLTMIFEI